MSFHLREIARFFGQPVELYRFTRQSKTWLYTNADRPITVGAETFLPAPISRTAIKDTLERQKNKVTITLPAALDVATNWQPYAPCDVVAVTIMALHHGDAEVIVQWIGRVEQPQFTEAELQLTCDPSAGGKRGSGITLRWQRACPLALYSQGCGMCNADKDEHALPVVLADVAGLTLTAEAFAAVASGRLAGGFVNWTRQDGLTEFRTITNHVGNQITLDYGADDLAAGLDMTVFPGCAHNWADCKDYFNNGANYGGCLYLPQENPFAGNPIWW